MVKIFQIDAFTDEKFKGNPAAVCLLDELVSDDWMQSVAAEMNLSETAFILRLEKGFALRWFTPKAEVDLCGHATLATAYVLYDQGVLKANEQAHFQTKSGILTAKKLRDGIELNFPAEPAEKASVPDELISALQVDPLWTGKNRFDYLVQISRESDLRFLRPDFARLKEITDRGVIVTCIAKTPGFDFISRFFAPAVGIDEDPVTGSAHCCLGPFWQSILDQDEFTAFQASARGGVIKVKVVDDRVLLIGKAVTVLKGDLL